MFYRRSVGGACSGPPRRGSVKCPPGSVRREIRRVPAKRDLSDQHVGACHSWDEFSEGTNRWNSSSPLVPLVVIQGYVRPPAPPFGGVKHGVQKDSKQK